MPSIQLSDQTFGRLQAIAIPFVDKPEDVIVRLLDAQAGTRQQPPPPRSSSKEYEPFAPPPLTFTKLLRASVNRRDIVPPRWSNLLKTVFRESVSLTSDKNAVLLKCPVNAVSGKRLDSGFRYLDDLDISIQGQDAEDAWRGTASLAAAFGISVEAEFAWRPNKKAAFPGSSGVLRLGGNTAESGP